MKRWIYPDFEKSLSSNLQSKLKIHPVLCDLLVQRGVTSYEEAHKFFRPKLDDLHDPFLMKGMKKAVDRIIEAKENGEKILLFGDYDVDGTTSVAVLFKFLKSCFPNLLYYIPNRYKEGYGLSKEGIDYANDNECNLIIALDCGIKAIELTDYTNSKGIDLIIGDHHIPGEVLPNAFAILNPKQEDCCYPFKELSGCGIGFKLIQALAPHFHADPRVIFGYLDLVAISVASDIVPIVGENRILAHFGLKVLNSRPSPGIAALMKKAGIRKVETISDIVFVIGPRINAVGRMGDANEAVKLLIAEDVHSCESEADWMNSKNEERKALDRQTTEEALHQVTEDLEFSGKRATIVFNEHWNKGVVGIVASRLIEHYHKPTIVLTLSNGLLTGSARSIKGFNITKALDNCADLLEAYGGHAYAAGLSIQPSKFEKFKTRFLQYCDEMISNEMLLPYVQIDAELDFNTINRKFYNIIKQFAPFGPSNRKPVFVSCNVNANSNSRVVKEEHLKLSLKQQQSVKNGIAFNMANHYPNVIKKSFDICYNLEENTWKGYSDIELKLKDIKL